MKIFIFVFITLFAFNLADDVTEDTEVSSTENNEESATETIVASSTLTIVTSSTEKVEVSSTENTEAPSTEDTAESTTENNSDQPDTSFVNKWLEKITEDLQNIVTKANEQMESMQQKMKESLDKYTQVPSYLRDTVISAINTFTEVFTSGLTNFFGRITSFVQTAFTSISAAMSGSLANVDKLQKCLKENGQSTNVTENALSEMQKCGTKQIEKVTVIITGVQEAVQTMVNMGMGMPGELMVCLQKFTTGIFGVVQGTTCLGAFAVKLGASGASVAAHFATSAIKTGVLITTAAGDVTGCITGKVNEMVQAGSKVSASVATCMAN